MTSVRENTVPEQIEPYQERSIASSLVAIADGRNAAAVGLKAFLWVCAIAKRADWQKTSCGLMMELCPAYLRTIEGVTQWAGRCGWNAARDLLKWQEIQPDRARELGAELRFVGKGRRRGRLILLSEEQLRNIETAHTKLKRLESSHECENETDNSCRLEHVANLPRKELLNRRSFAVCCPAHNDAHPSLVVWPNADKRTGGARCMVCEREGRPATWAVRFEDSEIKMFRPRAADSWSSMSSQSSFSLSRNNKDPQASTAQQITRSRVDSFVSTQESSATQINALIEGYTHADGYSTARRVTGRARRDLISTLKWHDQRSAGPAASTRAAMLCSFMMENESRVEMLCPSRLISVSNMRPTARDQFGKPISWKAARQRWILLDIDDIDLSACDLDKCAERIAKVVEQNEHCSGRSAIVQTSPTGLQVWCELSRVRHSPEKWHRLPAVVDWYSRLGEKVLKAARSENADGGYLDMSACAAGRFGRRPGWRLYSDGSVFRARLLLTVDFNRDVQPPVVVEASADVPCFSHVDARATGRSPSGEAFEVPPCVPYSRQSVPRKYERDSTLGKVQKHSREPTLTIPLIESKSLMLVKVRERPSFRTAVLRFEHEGDPARNGDVVGRPGRIVDSDKLSRGFRLSNDPHGGRRSNHTRSFFRNVAGVMPLQKRLKRLPSVRVRPRLHYDRLFRRRATLIPSPSTMIWQLTALHNQISFAQVGLRPPLPVFHCEHDCGEISKICASPAFETSNRSQYKSASS